MGKSLKQLEREIEKLKAEAEKLRRGEVAGVVARIKEAVDYYGITAADLGFGKRRAAAKKASPRKGKRLRVKYRDDAGNAWSGVGRRPLWYAQALAAGKSEADLRA